MQPVLPSAAEAYERLAPFYDELTREHNYEPWTSALEDAARRFGVSGRRLLDVACGTGKSFLPFLRRGYAVTACDLSVEMAAIAAAKAPGADVLVADVRTLERLGSFDLITWLDDSVNYLLDQDELEAACASPGAVAATGRRRRAALPS